MSTNISDDDFGRAMDKLDEYIRKHSTFQIRIGRQKWDLTDLLCDVHPMAEIYDKMIYQVVAGKEPEEVLKGTMEITGEINL